MSEECIWKGRLQIRPFMSRPRCVMARWLRGIAGGSVMRLTIGDHHAENYDDVMMCTGKLPELSPFMRGIWWSVGFSSHSDAQLWCFFFSLSLMLNKQSSYMWFQTRWRSRDVTVKLSSGLLYPYSSGLLQLYFLACSATSHYLNKRRLIVNWILRNKLQWKLNGNW